MPSVTEIAGNVPSTQMALQRWMAMEMRWNRNEVFLLSPEVADKRQPSLDRNWTPFTQIGPKVSKASGQNMYLRVKSMYFDSFLEAASSAAPPTVEEVDWIYEAANVSATVTSHMSALPWHQGTRVIPSGLFPLDRAKPDVFCKQEFVLNSMRGRQCHWVVDDVTFFRNSDDRQDHVNLARLPLCYSCICEARKCRFPVWVQLKFELTHHLTEDRTTKSGVKEANRHCTVLLLPAILLDYVDHWVKYRVFL